MEKQKTKTEKPASLFFLYFFGLIIIIFFIIKVVCANIQTWRASSHWLHEVLNW